MNQKLDGQLPVLTRRAELGGVAGLAAAQELVNTSVKNGYSIWKDENLMRIPSVKRLVESNKTLNRWRSGEFDVGKAKQESKDAVAAANPKPLEPAY
jgi:hypothetical protein